jgi:hypothetical protein
MGNGDKVSQTVKLELRATAWHTRSLCPKGAQKILGISPGGQVVCGSWQVPSISLAQSHPEGTQGQDYHPLSGPTGHREAVTYDRVSVQEAGLGQDRTADPAGASEPWVDQSLHSGMTGFILVPHRLLRSSQGCLLPEESPQVKRGWSLREK